MENAKIGEWYDDEKYWIKNANGSIVGIKLDEIVTEATRRGADQGKLEAWEDIKKLVESEGDRFSCSRGYNLASALEKQIDAKLASLSQSSNEKYE